MGRKKLPDEVKQMKGTLQPCRAIGNDGIVRVQLGALKAPDYLSIEGKKIWKEKTAILTTISVLTPLDLDALAHYCETVALLRDAFRDVHSDDKYTAVYDKYGNLISYVLNPNYKIIKGLLQEADRLGSEFGFTPASRSAIISGIKKETDKDEFSDFDE